MITILPEEINNDVTLKCMNNDNIDGYICFVIKGYVISITELKVFVSDGFTMENFYVYDGLLKACASYAFNHNCLYIYNENEQLRDICNKLCFETRDDKQVITIEKILNHSCHGGNI